MRSFVALVTAGLALAALPALGQTPAKSTYSVVFDAQRDVLFHGGVGEQGAFFTVNFKLIRHAGAGNEPGKDYKVLVELDGRKVAELSVPEPSSTCPHMPRSMGPPVTMMAGTSADAAPMSIAGVVLSQPERRTTPSSG